MTIFQSLILGIIQGITEFLPISSSGHLVLVPLVFGWRAHSLAFDTVLHFGTLLAVVFYFREDLFKVFASFFRSQDSNKKIGFSILVGSIPAVFVGFFLGDWFELSFRSLRSVAVFLLFGSFLLALSQVFANRNSQPDPHEVSSDATPEFLSGSFSEEKLSAKLNLTNSLFIGVFQALALFPGVSRSGATISSGLFAGLTKKQAARFSFLLSVPVVFGAFIFKVADSYSMLLQANLGVLFAGFLSSFVVGLLSIKFLMSFLEKHGLWGFVIYRVFLGVVLLLLT